MALVNFPQTIKTTASYPLTHSADGSEEPLMTAPALISGGPPADGFHKELPPDVCNTCFRVPNCCNCPTTGDDANRNPLPDLPQLNALSADERHREPSPSPSTPPTCETPPATALNIISGGEVSTEQNVPPCTHLMKYFVGLILVPLLVLKYQANPSALFAKIPAPTWSFLGFSFVYWLIAQQIKKMPNHNNSVVNDHPSKWWFQILNQAAIVSTLISTSSLLSILLPLPHQRLSIIRDKFWIVDIVGLVWLLIYTVHSVKSSISQTYAQYGVSSNPPV